MPKKIPVPLAESTPKRPVRAPAENNKNNSPDHRKKQQKKRKVPLGESNRDNITPQQARKLPRTSLGRGKENIDAPFTPHLKWSTKKCARRRRKSLEEIKSAGQLYNLHGKFSYPII